MLKGGIRASAAAAFARVLSTMVILGLAGVVNSETPIAGQIPDETMRCYLDPPRDARGLERCLAQVPRDVGLLLDLGAAHEAAGRLDEARLAYRRAVEADPRDADARARLGTALHRSGDLDGARREGALAVELRPHDPVALRLAAGLPDLR